MFEDLRETFGDELMENEHLTFEVGREKFAMDILEVSEIIGVCHMTRVPLVQKYICGVINLRGKVVPVMDLRIRFNCKSLVNTPETCIIVVEVANNLVGMIADRVSDVTSIPEDSIEPTPNFGSKINTDFIAGATTMNDEVILMIDIRKILGIQEEAVATEST